MPISRKNFYFISKINFTWLALALTFAVSAKTAIDIFMINVFIVWLSIFSLLVIYILARPIELVVLGPLSVMVISLFLFIVISSYEATRFGLNAVDAYFYEKNTIMLVKSSSTFSDFLSALQVIPFTDWGFLIVLSLMFFCTGEYHTSLIIINLIFHVISSYLVFKTSIAFQISRQSALVASLLFLLNPGSIIFMQLGLKEITFTLVVTLVMYASAKFVERRSLGWLLLALFISVGTVFFRIYFPGIFGLYLFALYTHVKRPRTEKIVIITVLVIVFSFLLVWVSDELYRLASLDLSVVRATRLGSGGSTKEFVALIYASIVGPFPKFDFSYNEKTLFTLADIFKNTISVLVFTLVLRNIFSGNRPILFWLLVPIFLNGLFISVTALSFDYRFHYPVLPILFVLLSYVLNSQKNIILLYITFLLNFCFIVVYN